MIIWWPVVSGIFLSKIIKILLKVTIENAQDVFWVTVYAY